MADRKARARPTRPARQWAGVSDAFKRSSFGVDGSYEKKDKEGITRATVGAGTLNVQDKTKQAELENTGKTQKLANINRDLNVTQEVTKDERSFVGVYVTDTSIKVVANGIGKAIDYIGELVKTGKITSDRAKELNKLKEAAKRGELEITCVGKQGWLHKIHDLFFTPAYAAEGDGCVVRFRGASALYDERGIRLSVEEVQALNNETAQEISGRIKYLVANIETVKKSHSESFQHKKLENELETQLKYLALCTSNDVFNSFVNNSPFFQSPAYANSIKVAKTFKVAGDHFAENKLGTIFQNQEDMLTKARQELVKNPGLLQVLTKREQENNSIGDPLIDATFLVYGVTLDPSLSAGVKKEALDYAARIIGEEWARSEHKQGRRRGGPVTVVTDHSANFAVKYVQDQLSKNLVSVDAKYFSDQVKTERAIAKDKLKQLNQLKEYVSTSLDSISDSARKVINAVDRSRLTPVIDPNTGEPLKVQKTRSTGRNRGKRTYYVDLYFDVDTGNVVEIHPNGHVIATGWDVLAVVDAASNLTGVGAVVKQGGKAALKKAGKGLFGSASKEFAHEGIEAAVKKAALQSDDIAAGFTVSVAKLGDDALPAGYRNLSSAGAAANVGGGLPSGYRRVVDTVTGDIEILGPSGNIYKKTKYDDYVTMKRAKNEEPRSFESYAQSLEHWARGSAAHQAEVRRQLAKLKKENPNAQIITTSSFRDAKKCTICFPDIMVVDKMARSVKFIEVKTGKASWTKPQTNVYPDIENGTAVLTKQQAERLGRNVGTTVKEAFPGGAKVETVYGPGYLD